MTVAGVTYVQRMRASLDVLDGQVDAARLRLSAARAEAQAELENLIGWRAEVRAKVRRLEEEESAS